MPLHLYATYNCMHLYIHTLPRGVTPPVCPHTPVHLYVLRGFCMLWGVVRGLLHVRHLLYMSPCMGVSPLTFTPTQLLASLCISMFQGYLYVIWGIFSLCVYLGVFPHLLGFFGASAHGVSMCLFLYILVGHYVSCFYYGYDYYSSSSVVSSGLSSVSSVTMAPSLLGLPATLDQCGVVQPPPLMPRGSGGIIGPAYVPQPATSIFSYLFWLMPIMLWVLHR